MRDYYCTSSFHSAAYLCQRSLRHWGGEEGGAGVEGDTTHFFPAVRPPPPFKSNWSDTWPKKRARLAIYYAANGVIKILPIHWLFDTYSMSYGAFSAHRTDENVRFPIQSAASNNNKKPGGAAVSVFFSARLITKNHTSCDIHWRFGPRHFAIICGAQERVVKTDLRIQYLSTALAEIVLCACVCFASLHLYVFFHQMHFTDSFYQTVVRLALPEWMVRRQSFVCEIAHITQIRNKIHNA